MGYKPARLNVSASHVEAVVDVEATASANATANAGATNAYGDSESVFVVFNFGLSEAEHEAAIAYAESIVPAPGVLAPLAFAGALATRRRR